MKKTIKIFSIIVIFFSIFSCTCFADVVMTPEDAKHHGMRYPNDIPTRRENTVVNNTVNKLADKFEFNWDIFKIFIIGVLVAVIIFCTVMCIYRASQEKKEKEKNDK